MRRLRLALSLLVPLGCNNSSASTPQEAPKAQADGAEAVTPPETAPAPTPPPATPAPEATAKAPATLDDACSNAALDLPKSTVIATVDGESIRADALNQDARDAERDALHTYCREVHRIRDVMARRAVDDHLLTKAATKAGTTKEQLVDDELKKLERPSDAEIEAFYAANKTEQAPPLEAVKVQVEQAIMKERRQAAYEAFVEELRGKAEIEMSLPDVRPPAVELPPAEHSPTFGPPDAKLTIVEFSDFECPYCSRAAQGVNAVKKRFGEQVRFVYRHFPLSFHAAARPAAEYSQCAHEQGKFWAIHDEIFGLSELGPQTLRAAAEQAGLDMAKLDACMASGRAAAQVDADMAKGREVGVRGTPSLYFNGRTYEGGTSPAELTAAVEEALRSS